MFKYADDTDLIPKPIKYGQEFKLPEKRLLRASRQSKPAKFIDAPEILMLLDKANPILRTMILLGINCGFGQTDCSDLPLRCVNLKTGWIDFPRPKTATHRRCPLWPETVAALKEAIERRRIPKDEFKDRVFITKDGIDYVQFKPNGVIVRRATFALNEATSPKTVVLTVHEEGKPDRTVKGIYAFENGIWKMCVPNFDRDAKGPPREFKTRPGDGLVLMELRRVTAKK